jgi:hypothetical protein
MTTGHPDVVGLPAPGWRVKELALHLLAAADEVSLEGPPDLTEPVLRVRAIIV